jgi:hypothetical protein
MYIKAELDIDIAYPRGLVLRAHQYIIDSKSMPASELGKLELPALQPGKHVFELRLLKPPANTTSILMGVVEPRIQWLCHTNIEV